MHYNILTIFYVLAQIICSYCMHGDMVKCCIKWETFKGENVHKFRSFRVICESLLHEIWACPTYSIDLAFRRKFFPRNAHFLLFANVIFLECFVLCYTVSSATVFQWLAYLTICDEEQLFRSVWERREHWLWSYCRPHTIGL